MIPRDPDDPFDDDPKKFRRNRDPDTSNAAAHSLEISLMEREVLEVIAMFPAGCIADQIAEKLPHRRHHSVTPRPAKLEAKAMIRYTGEQRLGGANRFQRVMVITDKGVAALEE